MPDEIYMMIAAQTSIASLVTMCNVNEFLSGIIATMFRSEILVRLQEFIPIEHLPGVFEHLTHCRGYFYGDIPFQILLRRRWSSDTLHVAVPKGELNDCARVFSRLGYINTRPLGVHLGVINRLQMYDVQVSSVFVILRPDRSLY